MSMENEGANALPAAILKIDVALPWTLSLLENRMGDDVLFLCTRRNPTRVSHKTNLGTLIKHGFAQ